MLIFSGNLFNTRVYPINARTVRMVEITYVTQMTAEGNNMATLMHPFTLEAPLLLRLDVTVLHDAGMVPSMANPALAKAAPFQATTDLDGSVCYVAKVLVFGFSIAFLPSQA